MSTEAAGYTHEGRQRETDDKTNCDQPATGIYWKKYYGIKRIQMASNGQNQEAFDKRHLEDLIEKW